MEMSIIEVEANFFLRFLSICFSRLLQLTYFFIASTLSNPPRSRYSLGQVLQQLIGKGILISSFSNLPAGSGMGGSSILASTILKSISHLVGYNLSNNSLIYLVSEVEQLLTTGGGWQDQVWVQH